jgi:hypothetical protein
MLSRCFAANGYRPTVRSRHALLLLGIGATVVSGLGLVVAIVVLFDHSMHPPHVDEDLLLGLIGLIGALGALGGSVNLLLAGVARRRLDSDGSQGL